MSCFLDLISSANIFRTVDAIRASGVAGSLLGGSTMRAHASRSAAIAASIISASSHGSAIMSVSHRATICCPTVSGSVCAVGSRIIGSSLHFARLSAGNKSSISAARMYSAIWFADMRGLRCNRKFDHFTIERIHALQEEGRRSKEPGPTLRVVGGESYPRSDDKP